MTTTRILYHIPLSPFSRRARLALSHKGLVTELRDARGNPAFLEEARKHTPLKTIPVLVEHDAAGETRALSDSTAIAGWLDRAYPDAPPLWPKDGAFEAFEVATLVDAALNALVDAGTRYFALREHAAWPAVKGEMVGRAQRALDALGERAAHLGTRTVAPGGWSAADIWLFTASAWLEGLPARAGTAANVAQLMTLGWTLPKALPRWADTHRARPDVLALDG